jgi:hypothetical protein
MQNRPVFSVGSSISDLAIALGWRFRGEHHTPVEPTWAPPQELISQLAITWPDTYDWPATSAWMEHLETALHRLVRFRKAQIPQRRAEGVVSTLLTLNGERHSVIIDFSDKMDQLSASALESATIYFKMQYRWGGYGDPRVVPGGYSLLGRHTYRYLPRLRRDADARSKLHNIYGRFGLNFSADIRRKAIALLADADDICFVGGTGFVRHSCYLRDIARSKIGIDMPGNGDFCFRLIDYLAIGVCIIAPRHHTELPIPLVDREQIVFCADDLSDLVPLCRHYLADDQARERIARNAREYFDRYLHRDQLARYYLHAFSTMGRLT